MERKHLPPLVFICNDKDGHASQLSSSCTMNSASVTPHYLSVRIQHSKKTHYISSEVLDSALGEVFGHQVKEYPAHRPQPQSLGNLIDMFFLGIWQQLHSVWRVHLPDKRKKTLKNQS